MPGSEHWAPNANPLTENSFPDLNPMLWRPVGAQLKNLGAQR
ncbi:protein of unknown function (plasmid) [Azospirillum baldaniorum]|uniref:Uncharacterized protein n=1 Tax=Azospirillum baldaniorum TaxID=1064539 RepID=A0A9P1K1R6_9PROT|nr:protein of unknown function [Azospirillum baldaniorum]